MSKHLADVFIIFDFLILPIINFIILIKILNKKEEERGQIVLFLYFGINNIAQNQSCVKSKLFSIYFQ